MERLLVDISPISLFVALCLLLGGWIIVLFSNDIRYEKLLSRAGIGVAGVFMLWMIGYSIWQHDPQVLSVGQLAAYVAGQAWFWANYTQLRIHQRSLIVLPLAVAVILMGISLYFGNHPVSEAEAVINERAIVHVMFALIATAILLGAGVYSAFEFEMHRQIKSGTQRAWLDRLPSSEEMSKLRRKMLWLGWIIITHSAVVGAAGVFLHPEAKPNPLHLYPMLLLWTLLTVTVFVDRAMVKKKLQWMSAQRQAAVSLALTAMFVSLLAVSLVVIFRGGIA
jgi:ABC-type uncharacterized transport system permease subunit